MVRSGPTHRLPNIGDCGNLRKDVRVGEEELRRVEMLFVFLKSLILLVERLDLLSLLLYVVQTL